jgi:hypothetical protein
MTENKKDKTKVVSATLATGTKVSGPEAVVNVVKARAEQSAKAQK